MFYSHLAKKVIPKKYHGPLLRVRDSITGHRMESYSQQGEDLILRILFSDVESGFYVDVGAFQPMRFSNTYYFYKRGWSGINIDATPGAVAAFRKHRPRDINIEAAVAGDPGEATLYMFDEQEVNTLSPGNVEREAHLAGRAVVSRKTVRTRTLGEILDAHLPTGQGVDFLSVDVEGYDLEVLQSNHWARHLPKVVLCEDLTIDNLDEISRSDVYSFLRGKDYILFSKCFNTLIFTHRSFRPGA
jgi:FkbM family methyltransferase